MLLIKRRELQLLQWGPADHGVEREGRVEGRGARGGRARGEPELVAVVGVALGAEEEAVVGVVLLLLPVWV